MMAGISFEIKYLDIKDNVRTGNEIWKDLLKLSSEGSTKK